MRRRSSLAAALYGAVLAVVAVLTGPGRQASAQSGVQTTPDGKHVLVSKDVGAERWAISLTPADGTVTGNVFAPGGGPPQFVWCQQREPAPDPAGELSFSCFGADACVASPCVASSWRF